MWDKQRSPKIELKWHPDLCKNTLHCCTAFGGPCSIQFRVPYFGMKETSNLESLEQSEAPSPEKVHKHPIDSEPKKHFLHVK